MLTTPGLTRIFANRYDSIAGGVRDASFTLAAGDFFTLLGPSGCGKTTTLRCLAGLERPDAGRIDLAGQTIFDAEAGTLVPVHRRGIGMVFQSYAIWPHMTVFENVAFPLRVAQTRTPREDLAARVERALATVGLAGYGPRPATRLSGGQQQRVALARAIVHEPKLLLLDEPLSNLDAALREEMRGELRRLQQEIGVTTVYVTHDQAEAMTMSDRIAVFNDGRIQQLAVPRELYEQPANSFVAQFIGENNKISGTITTLADGLAEVLVPTGERVRALAVNVGGIGSGTLMSVRPERVRIDPEGADYDNRFPARVEELIYLGDHVRARMTVLGNADFVVKVGVADLGRVLTPGTDVEVGWSSRDCRALDPL